MSRPAAFLPPSGVRSRIGLFGGSFDPPHEGHLHVAKTALIRFQLDQVWWFPTPGNPLKDPPGDYARRIAALQEMVAHNRAFRLSAVEHHMKLRYTRDLASLLLRHAPRARFAWIMGADSLVTFHHWKAWQEIANLLPIGVIARPGFERAALSSRFARLYSRYRISASAAPKLADSQTPAWIYLQAPLNPLSSTAIRNP